MITKFRRIIASIICFLMCFNLFPVRVFAQETGIPESYVIYDDYLQVEVSTKNGGFQVNTLEGNRFIKSDNNRHLLFADENFDTSFTTFRITKGGETKDYIFGREYGFLGSDTQSVSVVKVDSGKIESTWVVDEVAITQILTLESNSSNQHGMVNISYDIKAPEGIDVEVEARVLMDTALGYQDYAYYELSNADDGYFNSVDREQIVYNGNIPPYNNMFFAYDNVTSPKVTAYIVDGIKTSSEDSLSVDFHPEKVAFGHWNNLASTAFDFVADEGFNFTNNANLEYLTADSAFALFYDLGKISGGENTSFSVNYGVFSNVSNDLNSKLVMNFTSNSASMVLNQDKSGYVEPEFEITTQTQNVSSEEYRNVIIAVFPQEGIDILDADGNVIEGNTFVDPYWERLVNEPTFGTGRTQTSTFNFKANLGDRTQYRKIEFRTYEAVDLNNIFFTDDNLLSVEEVYIYCPTAVEPTVEFFGIEPQTVYYEGTRNVTIYGTNFDLLSDKARYGVRIEHVEDENRFYNVLASNISVVPGDNTIILTLDEEILPGQYEIAFAYNESGLAGLPEDGDKELPKIALNVSDDAIFAPPSFGVITIEQVDGTEVPNTDYVIKGYNNEADFEENAGENVFLIFRGQFDIKYEDPNAVEKVIERVEAVSLKKVDQGVSNVITINNSLDVEDGTIIINNDGDEITIDIDAKVYTTGARTSVWNGVSAITTFEDGLSYELTTYKINGDELAPTADIGDSKNVTFMWPGAASHVQKIAGLVFDLRYCNFGLLQEEGKDDPRHVVSFGAKMDLSFLIPTNLKRGQLQLTALERAQLTLASSTYTADELRVMQQKNAHDESLRADAQGGAFGVYVNNILFGGEFIGFNADVTVGVPSYTEGMPSIEGTLHVAVVNKYYEFGLSGSTVILDDVKFNAEILFKSKNLIPVPDVFNFYAGGFAPGIPLDPFGIIYLQGIGGGVSKIYDTFFGGDLVPPMQISMKGQMGLFGVLTGGLNATVGARGVQLFATNLGVKVGTTDIHLIDSIGTRFIWYPDLFISGELAISILDVIKGTGYIVYIDEEELVELFGTAALQIPEDIPLVGGTSLGNVDIGISNERVWAAARILSTGVGIVYYWEDGEVQINTGDDTLPQPSYGIAMASAVPIAYDAENDRTLFADVSGSVKLIAQAQPDSEVYDNSIAKDYPLLFASIPTIISNPDKTVHTINLGTYEENSAALTIKIPADNLNDAINKANNIDVEGKILRFYQNESDGQSISSNADANAKVSFDANVNMADITITFTDKDEFGKDIRISTPNGAELLLYAINDLPDMTSFSYDSNSNSVAWDGTKLDEFTRISVYAENKDGTLYPLGNADTAESKSMNLTMPQDMKSGEYTVKLQATVEGKMSKTLDAQATLSHTNINTPPTPNNVNVQLGGDYTIDVTGLPIGENIDGYVINIMNSDGTLTDFTEVYYESDGTGNISVGGQYTEIEIDESAANTISTFSNSINETSYSEVTKGLFAGESYIVSVATYNEIEGNSIDQNDSMIIISDIKSSSSIEMKMPVKSEFLVDFDVEMVDVASEFDSTVNIATSKQRDFKVTVNVANSRFTGTWEHIGSGNGVIPVTDVDKIEISMKDLSDGLHTIKLEGVSETGDKVYDEITFGVEATAPVIQLASPIGGGQFDEDGTVMVSGYVDIGSTLYISVNDGIAKSFVQTESRFDHLITGIPSDDVIELTIYAEDEFGNMSNEIVLKLTNDGITKYTGTGNDKISARLALYVNNLDFSDEKLPKKNGENNYTIVPMIVSAEGTLINITSDVEFSTDMATGVATVDDEGRINYNFDSVGIVNASAYNGGLIATTIIGEGLNDVDFGGNDRDKDDKTVIEFTDVMTTDYFYDAVLWAVEEGITNGTTETTFSPYDNSLRSQAITFIWRAMGSPKSVGENMFEDIAESEYYYEAVLWAVEQGITNGMTETTFVPSGDITRGQFVTFLWRAAGMPKAIEEHQFTDVDKDMYYSDAISWAVEQGITNGMTETTFAPDETCTRGQIVTFLYRNAMK